MSRNFNWSGEMNFVDIVNKNQSPGMVVVEVGCYDGATTRHYIDTVKRNGGHVYMIDTFMGTVQDPEFLNSNQHYNSLSHAYGEHNLDLYDWVQNAFEPYKDVVTIIKGFSNEVIPNIADKSVDIMFIDADHSYQAVKNDIELSIPKMKPGGLLCGHDCETFEGVGTFSEFELKSDFVNGRHAGVIQAVYDFFGPTQLDGIVWSVRL